ncbi:MAG: carboxylating nicotinate-nucleotide diphosphorylase [Alphaproteobacteria bacterium]|nr:carboxylating nicotinate-nucleotide diphosphorylase [Alphaproteobacteria bacterium]
MNVHPLVTEDIVRAALREDLGHGHDITASALIPADLSGKVVMRARQDGVIAGIDIAMQAFMLCDPSLEVTTHIRDGEAIKAGQDILYVEGPARSIVTAERTALNFISHMSGIATQTRRYVDAVKGTKAAIVCTRKTAPGLRAIQKYAVRAGGGKNHRFGLDDGLLIKDNHIALAGGVRIAIERARAVAGHMVRIELEVDTLVQLEEALSCGIDAVLLDNMTPDQLRAAVKLTAGRAVTEASGRVNLDTVRAVAESGVDMISVGALTHSVTILDIGLDSVE